MTDTNKPTNRADFIGDHPDAYRQHPPAHQEFHWIEGMEQGSPYARFLETTLDVAAGVHTCLQIAYASDLERAANLDADPGKTAAPAVGIVETEHLLRLSIASTSLLRDEARRRVEVLNDWT